MNDEQTKWLAEKIGWEHVSHGNYMNANGALMISGGELTERSAWDVRRHFKWDVCWTITGEWAVFTATKCLARNDDDITAVTEAVIAMWEAGDE